MTTANKFQTKIPLLKFLKTTFTGGFLVVLPAYLAILLTNKIIESILALTFAFLEPIANILGLAEEDIALPIALIFFVLICFIAGLILKSNYSRFFSHILEPFFKKIPGYLFISRVTNRVMRMEQVEEYDVAFVALGEINQALAPGFLIEQHEDGSYTVFVPTVPTPTVGNLYIVPNNRIFPVNVPLLDMVKFVSRWGEASPELLAAIRQIKRRY